MGNSGSSGNHHGGGSSSRRRNSDHNHNHNHHQPPPPPPPPPPVPPSNPDPPPPPPPEVPGNRYVFAAATPYPPQFPNPNLPNYYQYGGYYSPPPPAVPVPLPTPFDHYHRNGGGGGGPQHQANWGGGGRYPSGPTHPAPYVEHQKAVTIRNDVNLKKESLSVEPDELNPGKFLVAFTFDATVAGSITVYFFAKEGFNSTLSATKVDLLQPVTVTFKEGLGQKFRQPSGTGIDFSEFEEAELTKEGELEVYPLAVRAEASPFDHQNQNVGSPNSQITQALFEKKEKGEYRVRVVKQILWVNGIRYELQEIYGIGNSVDGDLDGNDPGKECVICLSEPRDTTVLPCRHMCMCSGCAKVLRFQTNRCPICRQPVERLLEIRVNNQADEEREVGQEGPGQQPA